MVLQCEPCSRVVLQSQEVAHAYVEPKNSQNLGRVYHNYLKDFNNEDCM